MGVVPTRLKHSLVYVKSGLVATWARPQLPSFHTRDGTGGGTDEATVSTGTYQHWLVQVRN